MVTAADVLTVALTALALVVVAYGGVRGRFLGLFISITSPWRALGLAAAIAAVRHVFVFTPAITNRLWRVTKRFLVHLVAAPDDAFGTSSAQRRVRVLEIAGVAVLMTVLAVVMTYPQVRMLDGVTDPGDPVFSVWRLSWIAHQLVRDPLHLFHANIMYPARYTLAYSDSLLLPDVVAAPFVWLGARPVVVHSAFLLGSFVLAGVCMYLFMRTATGSGVAGLVSAVAFAFYPYRFDQYCHFEQLFSFWMPLALWSLHRTVTQGTLRDGLLTGAAVAAQYLSGMYLGAFFVVWLVPVYVVLALGRRSFRASLAPLAAGAVLCGVLIAPTVPPHLAARQAVGERTRAEVSRYSAEPHDYLVASVSRVAYRGTLATAPHNAERDLFPGVVIVLLALVALYPPLSITRTAYAIGLLVALDASLGANGFVFPSVYNLLVPFRAFRVPARFSMLVGLSLAMLAGYGAARLVSRRERRVLRSAVVTLVCVAMLWECRVTMAFEPIWQNVPGVYAWFDGRPDSTVAVVPARPPGDMREVQVQKAWIARECAYMYYSTFHWHRLVNGYSGALPRDYDVLRDELLEFPTDRGLNWLRDLGVQYVVVHEGFWGHLPYRVAIERIGQRHDLREVARSTEGRSESRIFEVLPQ